MSTGEERHDRQPHCLGLAPDDAFDRGLATTRFFPPAISLLRQDWLFEGFSSSVPAHFTWSQLP
jgi:hypothetical protein